MSAQLHITHRDEYERGHRNGQADAQADAPYRPRGAATGTLDEQRAYGIGYEDGYVSEQERQRPTPPSHWIDRAGTFPTPWGT